jgi:hypothetical protein
MTFLNLFIINRSGGLIYNTSLSPTSPSLTTNDWLRIGSTFHSLHAIAGQAVPNTAGVESGGISVIEAGGLTLKCLQTPTNLKFIITSTQSSAGHVDSALKDVYIAYSDYALKNPFYEGDMPVRGELFGREVERICRR